MSLEQEFLSATVRVKNLPKQSNENLLKMYGLFKQATDGDNLTKKPGLLDIRAKAKWEAWMSQKGKAVEVAKQEYVDFVKELEATDERF